MKKAYYLFLILITLISCKKDRLSKDKEILVGTWEWVYTDVVEYGSTNIYYTKTPKTEGVTYQIIFLKKGKIEFLKNKEVLYQYRIVFRDTDSHCSNGGDIYEIWLDNNANKEFFVCYKNDTIKTSQIFPFDSDAMKGVDNYFVRK
jgi:hypothetical protein